MEAKELMIGDWVMQDDNLCNERPCKVIGIFDHCVIEVTGEKVPLHESHIKPIPLTKEILEKNGFERYGTSYILKESMFELTNPSNPDRYLDNYYIRLARQNKRVMYVHKLQHFMKEFGIKKEIEL